MHGLSADRHTPWKRIALIWLLFAVLVVLIDIRSVIEWRFPDPDDTLRLVQVRDLIAGQGWFDLHQYRINPTDSPVMHWSRIVDLPLAIVILALKPLFGQPLAEQIATLAIPLLSLGAILALVGHMAFRLFDREIAGLACLACGLSPVLIWQVQPLRIDHHAWQIVTVIFAASALMARRPLLGGALAGLGMAIGLSISLEVLPIAAAIGAVLLLRWIRDPAASQWLASYLASLAGFLVVLFSLTRGFADLTQYCDAISPAHLGLFLIVALGCSVIARKKKVPPGGVVVLLAGTGLVGVGFFLLSAPHCAAGPFGGLDPLVRDYWYVNVHEGRPFWQQPLAQLIPIVAQGFVALGAAVCIWLGAKDRMRSWWLDYTLLLGAALITGLLTWRSMGFVAALGAVPLGWLASRLLAAMRETGNPARKLAVGIALVLTLQPFLAVQVAQITLVHSRAQAAEDTGNRIKQSECDLSRNVPQLAALPRSTLFAPVDIGPSILYQTDHSVVATGHHRAQAAIHDVILAFTSAEDRAHDIIKRHQAGYVVVCTDLIEPHNFKIGNPDGLMAQLLAGDPPAWLRPVKIDAPEEFKVWKVAD